MAKRIIPTPQRNDQTNTASLPSIVLSSNDILDPDVKYQWEYLDPPPTELQVTLPYWPVPQSIVNTNTSIKLYLRSYFFDCLWRDSDNPPETITSNSGTSVSKKLLLTFYIGAQATTRLLRPNTTRTVTSDCDIIITRNNTVTGEWASNPYSTIENSNNADIFFENQYCNMNAFLGQPGLYVGDVDHQALAAVKANTLITVKITTDRTDYPSPFWYRKYLVGVSLWDSVKHKYEIVPADTEIKTYYKRLKEVTNKKPGGPYFPTALFKLDSPFRYQLHPFINKATIANVQDPINGELVISNHRNASVFISQIALSTSYNLSDINRLIIPKMAPSDARSFSVPVYDPSTSTVSTWTVADDQGNENPALRFVPYTPFNFPNGVWQGSSMNAKLTSASVTPSYSCFPFEQGLSRNQMDLLNDDVHFSSLPSTVKREVLPNHLYLFMDAGSSWAEDQFNDNVCTTGERALQFDLGRTCYVNKVQIIFPRSQEDFQPVKMGASLQKKYSGDAYHTSNVSQAIWFGNYQHDQPYGYKDSSNVDADYVYLNTHSQTANTLYKGSMTLMNVSESTTPSRSPYSGVEWNPYYQQGARGGRYHVVKANAASDSFVSDEPNIVNPAYDFYRQEIGPFVRGCTTDELRDSSVVKAITDLKSNAEWETKQQPAGHFFFLPEEFFLTTQGEEILDANLYVIETSGVLRKLLNSDDDKTLLLNTDVWKYVYPKNYSDTSQNLFLQINAFTSLSSYILTNFKVYLTSGTNATDYVLPDFLVKETYYFAPYYNQYATNEKTSNGDFRPAETPLGQKMVRQEFSQGQYFGLTCGSFLNDASGAHRYTRGLGNRPHLYSIRLCTQLFSFTTNQGMVVDPAVTDSSSVATFRKRYESGVLSTTYVEKAGVKYTRDEYDSTAIRTYPLLSGQFETVFVDPESGEVADRYETLTTNNVEALNNATTKLGFGTYDDTTPAQLSAVMEDDLNINEYLFYMKAASKTPLRRFMELQLEMVTS
jgi:hypothetical protein